VRAVTSQRPSICSSVTAIVRSTAGPPRGRTRALIVTSLIGRAGAGARRFSTLTMSKSCTTPSVCGLQEAVAILASTAVS